MKKHLSETPLIDDTAMVRDCRFGRYTEIGARTLIAETVFGDYSYVVNDSNIIYADIGKFVNIAAHTRLNPGQHPMDRASMHHFQYRSESYGLGPDDSAFFDWRRDHKLVIGHDVWIGHGAIIMGDVTIGTGAVVGAGAVVTKDVPAWSIVTGLPATPLRRRFAPEISDALERICWWDWTHQQLADRMADFRHTGIVDFCKKYDPA